MPSNSTVKYELGQPNQHHMATGLGFAIKSYFIGTLTAAMAAFKAHQLGITNPFETYVIAFITFASTVGLLATWKLLRTLK